MDNFADMYFECECIRCIHSFEIVDSAIESETPKFVTRIVDLAKKVFSYAMQLIRKVLNWIRNAIFKTKKSNTADHIERPENYDKFTSRIYSILDFLNTAMQNVMDEYTYGDAPTPDETIEKMNHAFDEEHKRIVLAYSTLKQIPNIKECKKYLREADRDLLQQMQSMFSRQERAWKTLERTFSNDFNRMVEPRDEESSLAADKRHDQALFYQSCVFIMRGALRDLNAIASYIMPSSET